MKIEVKLFSIIQIMSVFASRNLEQKRFAMGTTRSGAKHPILDRGPRDKKGRGFQKGGVEKVIRPNEAPKVLAS